MASARVEDPDTYGPRAEHIQSLHDEITHWRNISRKQSELLQEQLLEANRLRVMNVRLVKLCNTLLDSRRVWQDRFLWERDCRRLARTVNDILGRVPA